MSCFRLYNVTCAPKVPRLVRQGSQKLLDKVCIECITSPPGNGGRCRGRFGTRLREQGKQGRITVQASQISRAGLHRHGGLTVATASPARKAGRRRFPWL